MIRAFRTRDGHATWDVYRDAVLNGTGPHYSPAQAAAWIGRHDTAAWEGRLLACHTLVAEDAVAIRGFIALTWDGHVDLLFVRPAARSRGVAHELYDALVDHARAAGFTRLTTDASHLARSFLAKLGWVVTGTETVRRSGQRLTRFGMSCVLDQESQRS